MGEIYPVVVLDSVVGHVADNGAGWRDRQVGPRSRWDVARDIFAVYGSNPID